MLQVRPHTDERSMPPDVAGHSRSITGRGIESRETDNRNLDRTQVTDSSYDDAALRQELADALNVSPDDPKVSHALPGAQMRLAAQRALDAQAASPSAAPAPGKTAAGRAAVASAAADNPYAGLTMGEILSRPWKWSTVEHGADGITKTVDNEYIPDPNGPIGTKIETTTTQLAGVDDQHVQIAVLSPSQPATVYKQIFRDGELVSSHKQSTSDVFGTPVTDANGNPVVPDVRADIPGATPSGASGQTTPTPGPQSGGTPEHEVGRTYVDGGAFYQEAWTHNADGTTTYTWTRTRDRVTETATTNQNLTSLSDVTQLTFGSRPVIRRKRWWRPGARERRPSLPHDERHRYDAARDVAGRGGS